MDATKLNDVVLMFLNKKKTAWSPSTLSATRTFLNRYVQDVMSMTPEAFMDSLKADGKKIYTIQTYLLHAANFYSFIQPDSPNPYTLFRKEHRNVFKEAYDKKTLNTTYEEVKAILEEQEDSEEKSACLYILGSAQRSFEAGLVRKQSDAIGKTTQGDSIIGKGGRVRANFGGADAPTGVSYYRVYHYLKRLCGISPHGLRKLSLTRAGRNGARIEDLCEIAGWKSFTTARLYLQPQDTARLKKFLE